MHRTFEELAGQEIDGLYHGALFLKAGEEAAAEDLVLWTLTGAFQSFRRGLGHSDASRWLETNSSERFSRVRPQRVRHRLIPRMAPSTGPNPCDFPARYGRKLIHRLSSWPRSEFRPERVQRFGS